MSQVSPVVEEVATEEQVDLDMDKVDEVDFYMDEVKVEEAVEASVASVAVVVEAMGGEAIKIVTTTI